MRRYRRPPESRAAWTAGTPPECRRSNNRHATRSIRVCGAAERRRSQRVRVGVVTCPSPIREKSSDVSECSCTAIPGAGCEGGRLRPIVEHSKGFPGCRAAPHTHAAVTPIATYFSPSHGASAARRTRGLSGQAAGRRPGPQSTSEPRSHSAERIAGAHSCVLGTASAGRQPAGVIQARETGESGDRVAGSGVRCSCADERVMSPWWSTADRFAQVTGRSVDNSREPAGSGG